MTPRWILGLLACLALLAALILTLTAGNVPDGTSPPPAPPPRVDDGPRPGLHTPPPFFSGTDEARPSTSAASTPEDFLEPEVDEELAAIRNAGSVALRRLGPLMHELGDVKAYLEGVAVDDWPLMEVPEEVLRKLLQRLSTDNDQARLSVVLALSLVKLSEADQAVLARRLDAEIQTMEGGHDKNVVLALAFALHAQGSQSGLRRLEDSLARREREEVPDYRSGASYLLALTADPESSPALRALLAADPDRLVRKHAAVGLGKIGGDENRDALGASLTGESDVEVRAWAALAAGRAATPGAGADPRLLQALVEDESGEVRGASAYSLARAQGADSVPTLTQAFYADAHPVARIGAVAGVAAHQGVPENDAFLATDGSPFLVETLGGSEDREARYYSTVVLGQLPANENRTAALESAAASDKSTWVRESAIESLVRTRGEKAIPFLEDLLEKESESRVGMRLEQQINRLNAEVPESEAK